MRSLELAVFFFSLYADGYASVCVWAIKIIHSRRPPSPNFPSHNSDLLRSFEYVSVYTRYCARYNLIADACRCWCCNVDSLEYSVCLKHVISFSMHGTVLHAWHNAHSEWSIMWHLHWHAAAVSHANSHGPSTLRNNITTATIVFVCLYIVHRTTMIFNGSRARWQQRFVRNSAFIRCTQNDTIRTKCVVWTYIVCERHTDYHRHVQRHYG